MNQCVQEQIENSNIQAVVEAIVFKKYSHSRRQVSYLSQITIGEQSGFIVLEQEQIESIISENQLTNRIEAYEYELSWEIFQKELKYSIAQNDLLNTGQQGSNDQQKRNQQELDINDIELESNKANVSCQREQQIFSDGEGESKYEKIILNQEKLILNEDQKEKDALENLGFIEEEEEKKINDQLESKSNKEQQEQEEQFNYEEQQVQDQVLNTQSHFQGQEAAQSHEQQGQKQQDQNREISNSFHQQSILNTENDQIENDNLKLAENNFKNKKEQKMLQQVSQEQLLNQQNQLPQNQQSFDKVNKHNEIQQNSLEQDRQELQSKHGLVFQNYTNFQTEFLKQNSHKFEQQFSEKQQNIQQKKNQIINQDKYGHSSLQSLEDNKSSQFQIHIQEDLSDQSKQLINNSIMSKYSSKNQEENSSLQDQTSNLQITQSNQLVNLKDDNEYSLLGKKEEFDSKLEDQQQNQSQDLLLQDQQRIAENSELNSVKSEDAQQLFQSQDQQLASQVQDTKIELESQSSELLNLINEKEKRQKDKLLNQEVSQKACQKQKSNQQKQNNYDINCTKISPNYQRSNILKQSAQITLKNDQEIFKVPTQAHKRQQNEQAQKQKLMSQNSQSLIEIDQDDSICVDNQIYKVVQKPKQVTIQPSMSETNQFFSEESENLIKTKNQQIKITNQVGAMKYLVNEFGNRKLYGQFNKDKADIIINHKLNIREQHKDQVYTQFNITKCLYKVTWRRRRSGRIPLPSYFTFNEIYKVAPRLLLEYLTKMATLNV
ncbi:hypothetical protein ABPG74_001878 [Tetrahymena malaccensis]